MEGLKILSLCTSAGLWDKAYLAAGHQVIPGCELMSHKREMYSAFCGGEHLCHDIKNLSSLIKGESFDGVIAGIPCQSRTRLKGIRRPKFGDLLSPAMSVLRACKWDWFLFENVSPLDIPGSESYCMDAMNYGRPHQSRRRFFTFKGLSKPQPAFRGDVNDLKAYPVVAGRIYGPKRAAWLQGWPEFAELDFPCKQKLEALADGVPRCLADAWIKENH